MRYSIFHTARSVLKQFHVFSIDTVDAFMYVVNRSIVDICCFSSFLSVSPDNETNNCISLRIVFDNGKFT